MFTGEPLLAFTAMYAIPDSFFNKLDFENRRKKTGFVCETYMPEATGLVEFAHLVSSRLQYPVPVVEDNGYSRNFGNYGLVPPKIKYD